MYYLPIIENNIITGFETNGRRATKHRLFLIWFILLFGVWAADLNSRPQATGLRHIVCGGTGTLAETPQDDIGDKSL